MHFTRSFPPLLLIPLVCAMIAILAPAPTSAQCALTIRNTLPCSVEVCVNSSPCQTIGQGATVVPVAPCLSPNTFRVARCTGGMQTLTPNVWHSGLTVGSPFPGLSCCADVRLTEPSPGNFEIEINQSLFPCQVC